MTLKGKLKFNDYLDKSFTPTLSKYRRSSRPFDTIKKSGLLCRQKSKYCTSCDSDVIIPFSASSLCKLKILWLDCNTVGHNKQGVLINIVLKFVN